MKPDSATPLPGSLEASLKRERRLVVTACALMGFAFLMFLGLAGVGLWVRMSVLKKIQVAIDAGVDLPAAELARSKMIGTVLGFGFFGLFVLSALAGCGFIIAWMMAVRRRVEGAARA